MGSPCQTPTDPPGPSLPSLYTSFSYPSRAASRALLQRALLLLFLLLHHRRHRRYSFAPCAHPSLLRPLSLRPSSSVVREPRPPACYSRLSFLLRPLISLCVYALRVSPSPSVFPPPGLSYHTHAFSSSLFSPPAFPSFAYILPLLPVTVHHRVLVDPVGSPFSFATGGPLAYAGRDREKRRHRDGQGQRRSERGNERDRLAATLNMGRGPGTPGTSARGLRRLWRAGERGYASASGEL